MNHKLKIVLTAAAAAVLLLIVICGYGYVSQKTTANKGIESLKQKEYQKAYTQFHKASGKFTLLFTKQKTDVLFYEGEALYQMERYEDAVKIYDRLIERGESRAYSFKAFCLMRQGKTKEALDVCDEGIKQNPQSGEIYTTKYGIYAKQEKYKEGLKLLNKALGQDNLEQKKDVLFARISAYESMFDFDKAYEYAKEYVKAYPKDAKGKKELTFLETR